jgi:hypothetical protein
LPLNILFLVSQNVFWIVNLVPILPNLVSILPNLVSILEYVNIEASKYKKYRNINKNTVYKNNPKNPNLAPFWFLLSTNCLL